MNLAVAQKIARNLMDQYGLKDWTLKFGRGRKESGNCNYKTQTITFSAPLFHVWVQDHCRDTILHEIAHALTRGHNHDRGVEADVHRHGRAG